MFQNNLENGGVQIQKDPQVINPTADSSASDATCENTEQATSTTTVEAPKIMAEEFLDEYYEFRKNVMSGMVEYRKLGTDDEWKTLTEGAANSIILHSKRELGEDIDLKGDIKLFLTSDEIPIYDPVREYLDALPEWDGKDRVVPFWSRIPGISAEMVYFLSMWFRSVVVHWLDKDMEHGNESVPVFIGDQGIGKTTFCVKFLPECLRKYFLDHFNLGNKFDKEMALSRTLLINLDELDRYTVRQMTDVKQALSKCTVTARKIYGRNIDVLPRRASFIATTNCRQPLCDVTGSRRYLCIEIPKGARIDYDAEIDYEQLFAQVKYEVEVEKCRYWFNADETKRIQELNTPYQRNLDLDGMFSMVFRKPAEGEKAEMFTTEGIQKNLKEVFPRLTIPQMSSIKLGKVIRNLDIEKKRTNKGCVYCLVKNMSA